MSTTKLKRAASEKKEQQILKKNPKHKKDPLKELEIWGGERAMDPSPKTVDKTTENGGWRGPSS